MNLIIAVLPMLLLLGVWYYFIRQMRGGRGGYLDHQKRIADALERIAKALEERR
jgi:ATP-dependent Zn protease